MDKITYKERAAWYDIEQSALDDQKYLEDFVRKEGKSVLEIPCASGRNIPWLGRCGNQVVISDISPEMLEVCEQKIAQLDLDIQCVLGRMETVTLSSIVDTIIVPQDSFLMLTSTGRMLRALKNFRRNLNPSGRLLIDVPFLGLCDGSPFATTYFDIGLPENTLIFEWKRKLTNGNWLQRKRIQKVNDKIATINFLYEVYDAENHLLESRKTNVNLMIVTASLMYSLIKESGLKIEYVHRDYHKTPFTEDGCRAIFWLRNPT